MADSRYSTVSVHSLPTSSNRARCCWAAGYFQSVWIGRKPTWPHLQPPPRKLIPDGSFGRCILSFRRVGRGMNVFRFPFLSERMQRTLYGELDAVEVDRLTRVVVHATRAPTSAGKVRHDVRLGVRVDERTRSWAERYGCIRRYVPPTTVGHASGSRWFN